MRATTGTDRLFVDSVRIIVRGGRGGDGAVSFRREKFVPKGGPDGGDGGNGGSVILVAHAGVDTLLDLTGRHHWFAEDGVPGRGKKRYGRNGTDLEVVVPVGTLVYDDRTGRLLKDMVQENQRVIVAHGGRGGYGNARYATATNQTPREAGLGRPGTERTLRLELKLIADIGLIGLPNAGKSTLLARLTNARPKIAAYPFTTKTPQLGIAELPGYRRLVLADIPGLLEGAHEGVGLGDAFLRHIERTRVLVHLVDLCPPEGSPSPAQAYHLIRRELEKYSPSLAERDEIIVGNKFDLTGAGDALRELTEALRRPVLAFSGASGHNERELVEMMWTAVQAAKEHQAEVAPDRIDFSEPALVDVDADAAATRVAHVHPEEEDFGELDLRR